MTKSVSLNMSIVMPVKEVFRGPNQSSAKPKKNEPMLIEKKPICTAVCRYASVNRDTEIAVPLQRTIGADQKSNEKNCFKKGSRGSEQFACWITVLHSRQCRQPPK